MTFKITVLCGLLLCGILSVDSAVCGECMAENYAKCVNTTSFQFCKAKGTSAVLTEISGVHNCGTGKVCTKSLNICELEANIATPTENVCKDGVCPVATCKIGELHCTGPSKYVFCTSPDTNVPLSCPDGEYCSEELYEALEKICAKQSILKALDVKVTCESEAAVTPPTGLADKCWNAKDKAPGATSFLIANPDECKTYIYCEWSDNQLVGLQMNCKSGSRFDSEKKKCVAGSC